MKFLIIGDIHFRLNNPSARLDNIEEVFRDKFSQINSIIDNENIDYVITTGDLFDKAKVSNETLWFAQELISSLKIPVISIIGNHDMIGNSIANHRNSSLYVLDKLCNNLIITDNITNKEFDDTVFYFNNYGNDNFMLDKIDKNKYNVIVTHSMITTGYSMFDTIDASSINTNANLIITGHNHQKFHTDKVYNAGALIRFSRADGDFNREVEVGILENGKIKKRLLNIKPYTEVFNMEIEEKKKEILNETVMKELNNVIQKVNSNKDILSMLIDDNKYEEEVLIELKKYIERGV